MQLEVYLDKYKQYFLSQRFGERSWHEYERNLRHFLSWLNSKAITTLGQITPEVLVEYGNFIRNSYARHKNRPISESYYLHRIACIRALFTYLNNVEGYTKNPAKIVFPNLKPKERRLPKFLTPEDIRNLLGFPDYPLALAVVHALFNTGVRASELLGCNLHSLSIDRKELRVIGKGGEERAVPLTDKCTFILNHYLKWRGLLPGVDTNALFVSKKGRKLSYNQLNYILKKLGEKLGFHLHPHLLRHTFATYMLEEGSTIREVQEILGHKRVETTARYTHITPGLKEKHETIISKYS